MKQSLFLLLILFSLNIFGQDHSNFVPNTLIVKFKKIGRSSKISTSSLEVSSLKIKSASIDQVKQLFPGHSERASSGTSLSSASSFDTSDLDRIVEINYSPKAGVDIKEIEAEILKNPNVEYVDRRYIYHIYAAVPNDTRYTNGEQSYLSQVHAPEAWNVPVGSASPVVIAIVDSGSQLDHEDLVTNIYPGGYDLVGCCRDSPTPDDDPNVYSFDATHGVHVSGLASAVTDNGKGIASIAYNNAKLLIVKVSGDDFPKDVVKGYEGVVYSVDKGAKIINCSWGGPDSGPYGQNIINYAIRNDCLVVAAAGNGDPNTGIGYPRVDYPAAYPGVLAVASVSNSNEKSRFSNYGLQVSISAPGEHILSTLYNNAYGNNSGTSMATPLVSSAAALVKMVYPSLTMHQVGERLKATADNIDAKNFNYAGFLGSGRLNVYRALTNTVPTLDVVRLMQNYPNPSCDHTYIDFSIPSGGQTSLMLYSILGQPVKELVNAYLKKGPYHIPVYLGDLSAGIYIYMLRYGSTECALKLLVFR